MKKKTIVALAGLAVVVAAGVTSLILLTNDPIKTGTGSGTARVSVSTPTPSGVSLPEVPDVDFDYDQTLIDLDNYEGFEEE